MKTSTKTPYRKANRKVNGPKLGLAIAVKSPPIAPTYIAPTLWINNEANARITDWTTIMR
jgi:hypothetical protein